MTPDTTTPTSPAISLVAAGAALVGCTLLVNDHPGPLPGEAGVLGAINDLPRAIGAPLELIMPVGTVSGALAVALIVAVATHRAGPRPAIAVLLAALSVRWFGEALKELIERPRPTVVLDTITLRDQVHNFAYPSGHAAVAFALAQTTAPLVGRWRGVPFAVACAVAVARLYVGVHWPTDLIGGAALGVVVGAVALFLVQPPAATSTGPTG